MASWRIDGQYMETCNCSYLCPCITTHLTAKPTEGDCKAAIAMRVITSYSIHYTKLYDTATFTMVADSTIDIAPSSPATVTSQRYAGP